MPLITHDKLLHAGMEVYAVNGRQNLKPQSKMFFKLTVNMGGFLHQDVDSSILLLKLGKYAYTSIIVQQIYLAFTFCMLQHQHGHQWLKKKKKNYLQKKTKIQCFSESIDNIVPVSYTHLDVYKRKLDDSFKGTDENLGYENKN